MSASSKTFKLFNAELPQDIINSLLEWFINKNDTFEDFIQYISVNKTWNEAIFEYLKNNYVRLISQNIMSSNDFITELFKLIHANAFVNHGSFYRTLEESVRKRYQSDETYFSDPSYFNDKPLDDLVLPFVCILFSKDLEHIDIQILLAACNALKSETHINRFFKDDRDNLFFWYTWENVRKDILRPRESILGTINLVQKDYPTTKLATLPKDFGLPKVHNQQPRQLKGGNVANLDIRLFQNTNLKDANIGKIYIPIYDKEINDSTLVFNTLFNHYRYYIAAFHDAILWADWKIKFKDILDWLHLQRSAVHFDHVKFDDMNSLRIFQHVHLLAVVAAKTYQDNLERAFKDPNISLLDNLKTSHRLLQYIAFNRAEFANGSLYYLFYKTANVVINNLRNLPKAKLATIAEKELLIVMQILKSILNRYRSDAKRELESCEFSKSIEKIYSLLNFLTQKFDSLMPELFTNEMKFKFNEVLVSLAENLKAIHIHANSQISDKLHFWNNKYDDFSLITTMSLLSYKLLQKLLLKIYMQALVLNKSCDSVETINRFYKIFKDHPDGHLLLKNNLLLYLSNINVIQSRNYDPRMWQSTDTTLQKLNEIFKANDKYRLRYIEILNSKASVLPPTMPVRIPIPNIHL